MTPVGHDIVVMSTFHSLIWHGVTWWRVSHAEQAILTLPEHLISPLVFIEAHVVLSFVSP